MLDALKPNDWGLIFKVAMKPGQCRRGYFLHKPFTRDDVSEVLALERGVTDQWAWACLCRLNDGNYAFVKATLFADDGGWNQEPSGWSRVTRSLLEVVETFAADIWTLRKGFVDDLRKLVHRDDIEEDVKRAITELVLEGEI